MSISVRSTALIALLVAGILPSCQATDTPTQPPAGAFVDTDGDGIPDQHATGSLNIDTDDDGIPDQQVTWGPFVDTNDDGLPDQLASPVFIDTDGDGIPDQRVK